MRTGKQILGTAAGALLVLSAVGVAAQEQERAPLTVAYALEWPLPLLLAKEAGAYAQALDREVRWVAFETGRAVAQAMATGAVQIAVSQEMAPFVIAASQGVDIRAVDVAVSYAENDNCVVASGLGIDKTRAAELEGKRVAVPLGTASHYGFLRQMAHFGVDLSTLEVLDMPSSEGAAALGQGDVDMACGAGGGLARMKGFGEVLLTGAEKEALGIGFFDVTAVRADLIATEPEAVAQFLKITAQANADWADDPSEGKLAVIASQAGMELEAARAAMATMQFPGIEAQLSQDWLGAAAAERMREVAEVFLGAGTIGAALEDYAGMVDTGPLEAARDQ